MAGTDQRQLSVDLRPETLDSAGSRILTAWADGRLLGRVTVSASTTTGWLRISVDEEAGANESAERRAMIAAIVALGRAEQPPGLVLAASANLLLRHEARAVGFTGALRGDLAATGAALHERQPPIAGLGARQERFLADLQRLLPGVTVVPVNPRTGRLRSIMRTASTGVAGTVHLDALPASGEEPLRLAVPLGEDVMAEAVALAVDTALSIRRRFHPLVDSVRIFFDHSIQGLRTGSVGGLADAPVRDVHLNPSYALVSEMEALDRYLRQRRIQPDPTAPERKPPLTVIAPFTRIDSVVSHEYWHQIEFGFESSRYRDSVEFRRVVGGYFGVETLEHVIKGKSPSAPPAWQAACGRLAREVSAYATTAPKEATAELFAQWWCTAGAPPPSAQAFGEVLRRFFPSADLRR